ncbi:hypothetical protein AQJ91_18250 [Streptomyces dysideae]|uniref:Uncharacterized protein n=1 Tax=Streptomyces dysideae TaxID=909626 RepID=A0A101UZH5_9ACTN|nr:hypothetical protein AQJ91_18250 [Streptomyces dysideae]
MLAGLIAGRELMRQMMQDQLDARTAAEERRREVTGADGVARTRAERGHVRLLATTVGRVEISRRSRRSACAAGGDSPLGVLDVTHPPCPQMPAWSKALCRDCL